MPECRQVIRKPAEGGQGGGRPNAKKTQNTHIPHPKKKKKNTHAQTTKYFLFLRLQNVGYGIKNIISLVIKKNNTKPPTAFFRSTKKKGFSQVVQKAKCSYFL
jgi:hypothetical protein